VQDILIFRPARRLEIERCEALEKEFDAVDREFTNDGIALGWTLEQARLFWQKKQNAIHRNRKAA
jgi:hypothetical protein